jgi:ribosome-associated protein
METKTYELTNDYIELIKLLKLMNIASSGAHAKLLVEKGEVKLNGITEARKRAKIRSGDIVETVCLRIKIKNKN